MPEVGTLEHLDRLADRGRAALALAREDQRHPLRAQREERRPVVRVRRGQRGDPVRGVAHGRRVAGVERRVDRFREHHDGAAGFGRRGLLGGGQQDLLRVTDRPAPGGDVTAQVLDRYGQIPCRRAPACLVQQRRGAVGQAAQPGRVGCRVEQPALRDLIGRQPGAPLERP